LGDLDLAWNALEDVLKYIAGALELRVFKRRPLSDALRYRDYRPIYEISKLDDKAVTRTRVQGYSQVRSFNT
jgi:hypothetical protein